MLKQHTVVCLLIICSIILVQPTHSHGPRRALLSYESEKYAVIFDAGSTGSRVHVFGFDKNMNLLRIGQDFELYIAVKPGLSSYASDPEAAALSLKPMLDKAEGVVPKELLSDTPVKVGATAGLRMLKGDISAKILDAVRKLIKDQSSFKYKAEWVSILEGSQEATYFWGALNYLLGTAGKDYSETVGTVDLGGGSVQMTYAISKEAAEKAPKLDLEGKEYVQKKDLMGTTYYLYAHSYLDYGLLAARAQILKVSGDLSNPCIVGGYDGTYTYNGVVYKASARPYGSSLGSCRAFVRRALKIYAPCKHQKCTFNGVWSGNGGAGQANLYVASYFFDIAKEVGIVNQTTIAHPRDFLVVAEVACNTKYNNIKSLFPQIEERDVPFICMDLVYEYTLLVDGFGLKPFQKITLVNQVLYKNSLVGAAWPLGSALDAISSTP